MKESKNIFLNKTLLITGGTGSFGNAMLKGFLKSDLKEIRIFSRDEKKQEDMRIEYRNDKLNFVIGDIRDFDSINNAMSGVDYVFHLAAESRIQPAIKNPSRAYNVNVIGTLNILELSRKYNIKRIMSMHHIFCKLFCFLPEIIQNV